MVEAKKWVVIGKFGRPHGIKGFINVNSFTEPKENLLQYPIWHCKLDQQWTLVKLKATEVNGSSIRVKIAGYDDREAVSKLTNIDIAILEEDLPELDESEYYWHQLYGLTVRNKQKDILGKVTEIMSTGSNDVLIVEGEKRHLVPYLPQKVILEVDLSSGVIWVDWEEENTT